MDQEAWVDGILQEHGQAPYQFDEKNGPSYYVTLARGGRSVTLWGVDLERAIEQSGLQPGDWAQCRRAGFRLVDVPQKVYAADGRTVIRTEIKQVKRNAWEAEPVQPHNLSAAAEETAERSASITARDERDERVTTDVRRPAPASAATATTTGDEPAEPARPLGWGDVWHWITHPTLRMERGKMAFTLGRLALLIGALVVVCVCPAILAAALL